MTLVCKQKIAKSVHIASSIYHRPTVDHKMNDRARSLRNLLIGGKEGDQEMGENVIIARELCTQ